MSTDNLLAAFDKNDEALRSLLDNADFEIEDLEDLMNRRHDIIDEITKAGFEKETLEEIHRRHARLERTMRSVRDTTGDRLKAMARGQKAMKRYAGSG